MYSRPLKKRREEAMNKEAFLKELEKRLRYIPAEDRQDAIEYYEGYIADMGLAEEDDIVSKLGTPKDVAKNILEDCKDKHIDKAEEQKTVKSRATVVWLSVLGVLSLPVSLPIAIALIAVVLALGIAVLAVVLSLIIAAAAVAVGGVAAIFWGFFVPGIGQKLFTIGTGLALTGTAVLVGFLAAGMIKGIRRSIYRKKKEEDR